MGLLNPDDIAGSVKVLKDKLEQHREGWTATFKENRKFYRGEQWTEQQKSKMRSANAEPLVLNDYFAAIRDKKGQIQRGKPTITAFPRDNNDVNVANFYRDLIAYTLDHQNYDMKEDLVITDSLVGGLGWLECFWNPLLEDRQGDLEINYLDPLSIYPDTEASLPDYSDGEFMLKKLNLPTERVKVLFPKHAKDIGPSHVEGPHTRLGDTGDYISNFDQAEEKFIRGDRTELLELWLKEHGTWALFQYLGPDVPGMESRQILWHKVATDKDLDELVEQYDENYDFVQIVDHRMKIITVAGGVVVQDVYSEYAHNTFPFVPFVGIPTETAYPSSQGDQVKEAQKISNTLYSLLISNLTTMNNPIWLAAKGLVDRHDLRRLERDGFKSGAIIKVKPPIEQALRREPGVGIDASIQLVMQMLDQKMERIFGVRGSLRGEREQGVKSGKMLQTLIQQASQSISSDNMSITQARRQLGVLLVSCIQQFYSPDRAVRVVGQDRAMAVQQHEAMPFDLKVGKFDVIVGDISSQPSNNLEEFMFLVELRQMGVPIDAKTLIEAAPLANKEVILQRLQQQEQMMAQQGIDPSQPQSMPTA